MVSGRPFGGLIDGSRRTVAAMFSDTPVCVSHAWCSLRNRKKSFSKLMPSSNTSHCISHHILLVFKKIDGGWEGMCDHLTGG